MLDVIAADRSRRAEHSRPRDPREFVDLATQLSAEGLAVGVALIARPALDADAARVTKEACAHLLMKLYQAGLSDLDLVIPLAAVGAALDDGNVIAREQLRELCAVAEAVGSSVTIDTVGHDAVDQALAAGRMLMSQHDPIGLLLYTDLRRTLDDIHDLASTACRVHIVRKGGRGPRAGRFRSRRDIDAAYVAAARALLRSNCRPRLVADGPREVGQAYREVTLAAPAAREWEIVLRWGDRPDATAATGAHRVRVFVPFGSNRGAHA